jgi:hypothetical protein
MAGLIIIYILIHYYCGSIMGGGVERTNRIKKHMISVPRSS